MWRCCNAGWSNTMTGICGKSHPSRAPAGARCNFADIHNRWLRGRFTTGYHLSSLRLSATDAGSFVAMLQHGLVEYDDRYLW